MNPLKNLNLSNNNITVFCDRGIVFSLCALIFVLPVSIALLDSFAALAIFFYIFKKANQIVFNWPLKISQAFFFPSSILDRPIQFLALAVFISVLHSQYPGLSLFAFFGKFLKSVFLYLSFIEVFTTDKRIRIFLKIFLASAFVVALNGVVEHYKGIDFLKGHVPGGGRINSSFATGNGLGAYLIPVIVLVVQLLFSAISEALQSRRNKSWFLQGGLIILLALLMSCLCWTYSRSAWVGFLGALVLMVWMDQRKILYAGVLLLIFIFIFLPSLSQVRHMSLINDGYSTARDVPTGHSTSLAISHLLEQGGSGRKGFWGKAISIIRMSPVLGTGLNTYTRVIRRDPDQRTWWYAHNCYLQMTAETGLVGLICFLWMLFVLFWQGLNCCRTLEGLWPQTFLQGTLAGLFGFLIQSFFDNTFYTVQLGCLLWMLIGLAVALMRGRTNE